MSRICARCELENPEGMNFCGRCGALLGIRCPDCGLDNSPDNSLCEHCASPLPEITLWTGAEEDALILETAKRYLPMGVIEKLSRKDQNSWDERRDVAILFADLCDYTALSESFDPELVYGMLNAVLDVLVKEIHRFEGIVNQFRGDGLMATFGIPLAHENDPERAVQAALNMHNALRDLNREVESRLGLTIKMRIGINHGEVIAGSIGSEERKDFTIIGSAVNLAARLESAAEPDTVLVSGSVYRRTYRLFEFQAQSPLKLKGIAGLVENWLALGPKEQSVSVRGLEGVSTRMIGRDKELADLCAAAGDLVAKGAGRLILVTGEAGIGKSRLTAEFKAALSDLPVIALEGVCQAHTAATAYSLFASLLENILQLPVAGSEAKNVSLESWLLEYLPDRASTLGPFLAHLLDMTMTDADSTALQYLEPSQLQQQVFIAVRDLVLHIASKGPVVIILEDLHWIDSSSLELLAFLAPLVNQAPLVFYGISRPLEGLAVPRLKELGTTRLANRFLLIELNPLSTNEAGILLTDLLTIPAFPDVLRQTILERVGGNPFFLEEFIRMLIENGYIVLDESVTEGDRWVAVQGVDFKGLRVPQTLQELIITRMDQLPVGPQFVLACASVLGQSFNQALLSEVVEPQHRLSLDTHLQYLQTCGFISPHEMADVYLFRHVVTQEAVYASLITERQRVYHRRAGEGLEKLYAGQLDEHVEQLAYHYNRSGVAEKAVPYLTEAAIRDARRYANEEALHLFDQALTLLPALPLASQSEYALKIAAGRGDIYLLVGRYADARREYWRGLGVLHGGQIDSVADGASSLVIQRKMGVCHERQGDYTQAMLWYQLSLACQDNESISDGHELEVARLYSDIGWLHFRRNELADAESWLSKALVLAEETEHRPEIATIHNRMGGVWFRQGDLIRASQEVAASLVLYESMGDLQGIARGYANLGVLAETQGQWNEAAICFKRSLEAHERTGWVRGATIAGGNLGVVYTNLGDIPLAKQYLEQSLQGALATDDSFNIAKAYMNLGRASIFAGDWSRAKEYLLKAMAIYEELEDGNLLADTCELLGEAVLGNGELAEAETLAKKALEMALQNGGGSKEREARAWRLMGMVERAGGHLDRAMESLRKSRQMFEEQGHRLELGQVMLEEALLYRNLGQIQEAQRLGKESAALCQSINASLISDRASNFLDSLQDMI